MTITRYKYKNLNQGTEPILSCKQEDIVNRVGIMTLQEEKELMEKAGRTFQDYISKVYNRVIGKGKDQQLENGINISQFKETLDVIDAQRIVNEGLNTAKKQSEEIEKQNKVLEEQIEQLNIQQQQQQNTDTSSN